MNQNTQNVELVDMAWGSQGCGNRAQAMHKQGQHLDRCAVTLDDDEESSKRTQHACPMGNGCVLLCDAAQGMYAGYAACAKLPPHLRAAAALLSWTGPSEASNALFTC